MSISVRLIWEAVGSSRTGSDFGTHLSSPLVSFAAALTEQWLSGAKGIGLEVGKPDFDLFSISS